MKGSLRAASATAPLSGRPGSATPTALCMRCEQSKTREVEPAFALLHPRSSRDVGGRALPSNSSLQYACRGAYWRRTAQQQKGGEQRGPVKRSGRPS